MNKDSFKDVYVSLKTFHSRYELCSNFACTEGSLSTGVT